MELLELTKKTSL
jgi:NACalpha-BTF3-like transcription factor